MSSSPHARRPQNRDADAMSAPLGCSPASESGRTDRFDRQAMVRRVGNVAAGATVLGIAQTTWSARSAGAGVQPPLLLQVVNNASGAETGLTASSSTHTFEIENTGLGTALTCSGASTQTNRATVTTTNTGTNAALFAVQANTTADSAAVLGVTWGPGPAFAANTLHADGAGFESTTIDGHGLTSHVFGSGRGVHVKGHDETSAAAGIYSDVEGTGIAVDAYGRRGRGGRFRGAKAQITLTPASGNHPASGSAGDFFVDAQKRLWFCKGTTNWVQLA